jgi:hypothetical protein
MNVTERVPVKQRRLWVRTHLLHQFSTGISIGKCL